MDTALVDQIFELFPHIEEDFLLGLCDAYKEENLDLDEMVDVVFSYEYPPLKKVDNAAAYNLQTNESEDMQNNSENVVIELVTEILESDVFKEDELMVGSSRAINIVDESNIQMLYENYNENVDNCTSLKDESCDNNILSITNILPRENSVDKMQNLSVPSTQSALNKKVENCSTKGYPDLSDLEEEIQSKNLEEESTFLSSFNLLEAEEDSESIARDQIKLLFLELPFGRTDKDVSQIKNINCEEFTIKDKRVVYSNTIEYSLNDNKTSEGRQLLDHLNVEKSTSELNSEATYVAPVSNDESSINQSYSSNSKTTQADTCLRSSDLQPCASKSVRMPILISNQSKTTAQYATSSDRELQPALTVKKVVCDDLKIVCENQASINSEYVSTVSRSETQSGKRVHENLSINSPFASTESKYSLLCRVFPDADEKYLFAKSKNITSSDELLMFISNSVDDKLYPKGKSPEENTPEVLGFDCTVEEFLQYIPDPIAEFQNSNYTRTGYEENAEIYLKSRYHLLSEEFLKQRLRINNYNLVKVCQELDSDGYVARPHCWENIILHHTPSVFFHQEVWYIEHKTDIQNFLNNAIEAAALEEELNKPPPPTVDEVFECTICSEEILEYSDLGTCDGPSGHLFCKNCIKRHTEIQMGEAKTTFTCLHNCGGFIHLQTIKEVLPPQTFDILMNKVVEEEVRRANIPGVETCPFCPYAYGPGEEDPVFICLNSECLKRSCRTCRKEDHFGMCEMFKNDDEEAARHFIENKMTEALVRNCYNCGKGIVKDTGCNKMQCVCGAKMCYLCRQPVQDYSHFNGQGGDNYDRCELFSDDKTLHDQPVSATAKRAFDQLIANNPQLNLDANKIIPKL